MSDWRCSDLCWLSFYFNILVMLLVVEWHVFRQISWKSCKVWRFSSKTYQWIWKTWCHIDLDSSNMTYVNIYIYHIYMLHTHMMVTRHHSTLGLWTFIPQRNGVSLHYDSSIGPWEKATKFDSFWGIKIDKTTIYENEINPFGVKPMTCHKHGL